MKTLTICITVMFSVTLFSGILGYALYLDEQSILARQTEQIAKSFNGCQLEKKRCIGYAKKLLNDNKKIANMIKDKGLCESM